MLLECRHCEALVDAIEIANFVDDGGGFFAAKYTFAKCPSCKSALVAREYEAGEESGKVKWGAPVRMFPAMDRESVGQFQKKLHELSRRLVLAFVARRTPLRPLCAERLWKVSVRRMA
jgi:hypothetical protein